MGGGGSGCTSWNAAYVDAALRAAVSAQDVPGVVAMAATETGVVYEGVFGSRRIHEGRVMTRDTIFRVALMVKLITTMAAAPCLPTKNCDCCPFPALNGAKPARYSGRLL